MPKHVSFEEMLASLQGSLEAIPEHRTGLNTQYRIADAGLSAFSVFCLQSPSFLAHQRVMRRQLGRDNAASLFGIRNIPSDGQIRDLLDPVDAGLLREPFWDIHARLEATGHLDGYRHVAGTLLCSLDGTWYFSSERIHCPQCTVYEQETQTTYAHMVLAAVVSAPGQQHVLALEPEFVVPQDGHDKQDCEQRSVQRWVTRNAQRFEPWSVTILADDLHSHQPLCQLLLDNKLHFILTAKPQSHQTLYQEIELLSKVEGAHHTHTIRRWTGRRHELWRCHWVNDLPLRTGPDALHVNWCELTVLKESTGEKVYHNAWITDHELTQETVEQVAEAGRSRWKIENEGFNVLKNQGYEFEHNFGHGKQHLSSVLLTMLFLAFLFHSALQLAWPTYQALRQALGARRTFFEHLRALTTYVYFAGWDQMLAFMAEKLKLKPV